VIVVGGGLIGTAIARGLARRGCHVRLVGDDRPGTASPVAAGMLAPVTEAVPTELGLAHLNLDSLQRYATFAEQLTADTGLEIGLRKVPTVSVGFDSDDAARLADLASVLTDAGLEATSCTGREVRRHVPLLAPQVRAGLLVPGDWSVDNRLLWRALRADAELAGVERITDTVTEVVVDADRCTGVRLASGPELRSEVVVWAAGAWSARVPLPFELPVRPVKGQVVRLRAGSLPVPGCTVRAFVRGFDIYLVPRESGEVVVGASSEDRGFEIAPTAGPVHDLLRDARTVLPITAEYEFAEVNVGFRPASASHTPILGPTPVDGLVAATGHHRNGVLLTPITAELITDLVVDGHWPALGSAFNPYTDPTPNHRAPQEVAP